MGETTGKKIRNIVLLVLAMLLVLGAAVMIFQNRFVLDIGGFWDALFGNRNGKSEASVFFMPYRKPTNNKK